MKKLLMSIVAVLFAANSFAQYSSGGFSLNESTVYYGARIGMTASSISGDDFYVSGGKVGLTLGAVLGLRLSEATPIFLESGLYYTERGAQKNSKNKASLTYFELPILLKYGIQVSNDIAVLPYLGPYFSFGFAGKTKFEGPVPSLQGEKDDAGLPFVGPYNDGSYADYFNHLDMGIKLGCGFEYKMIYVELGYQIGLANIAKAEDASLHGNAFFANLGVNF